MNIGEEGSGLVIGVGLIKSLRTELIGGTIIEARSWIIKLYLYKVMGWEKSTLSVKAVFFVSCDCAGVTSIRFVDKSYRDFGLRTDNYTF